MKPVSIRMLLGGRDEISLCKCSNNIRNIKDITESINKNSLKISSINSFVSVDSSEPQGNYSPC